ncbi:MAG: iron-sulfur cluster assembly accessory protein [Gammaproteobacteria bacterium]|nr:iron-sulfur cluster assembly accessory protein [Gammaproteobacteria bacterium]
MSATAQNISAEQKRDVPLHVTPEAQSKLAELLAEAGDEVQAVRVFVSGGGCSGVSYGMTYTDQISAQDHVIDGQGIKIAVDAVAYGYLMGAEIDFVNDSMNPSFVFRNTVQTSTGGGGGGCGGGGCGSGGCGGGR